jgi:Fe-S-cluster-containing hydrogenase component 2
MAAKIILSFLKKGIDFSKNHARIKTSYFTSWLTIILMGGTIMAYKITDACVSCGSCADQCPVEAIAEGDGKYEINADVCVSCGACADQCPVEAIEEE